MQCCAARQNTRLPVAAKLPGPEPATEPAPAPAGDARLRAELEGLKLSALRRRARDTGASEKLLDDAGDCDHPREGLIALVIQMAGQPDQVGEADPASALLREELGVLKFSMLRKRALALGIDAARLEEADDEEDPRAATIELIVATAPPPPSPVDPDSALRAELSVLKLSGLRRRANELTHDEDQLDEAADSSDPCAALIDLIVSMEATAVARRPKSPSDMPHFGRRATAVAAPTPAAPTPAAQKRSKHVMLSYQW